MSAFKLQVQQEPDVRMVRGEKGHAALSAAGLGDCLLALFDRFFQGISEHDLRDFLLQILKEARQNNDTEQVVNVFVMAFHSRWCRGGKGAKECFYKALKTLYEEFPAAVIKLLPLVPQYGYWKDLLLLVEEIQACPVMGVDYSPLLEAVWEVYGRQLLKDYKLLETHRASQKPGRPSLSFAGKWAPREGNHFDKAVDAVSNISKVMFRDEDRGADVSNDDNNDDDDMVGVEVDSNGEITMNPAGAKSVLAGKPRRVRYRHVVTALTASLDVPEVKMAGGRYADINISSVPSRCMSKFTKAFANEDLHQVPSAEEEVTGNRFPESADRVACRKHLLDSVVSGKGVQGSQNYPHEYVMKVESGGRGGMSTMMKLTLNAQWKSMRESIEAMVAKRSESLRNNGRDDGADMEVSVSPDVTPSSFSLGKVVPLSDVSGSMHGTPMMVSIALGILCSELTNEAFRDLVLTFTDDAQWEDLGSCANFVDKVARLKNAPWGGTTNFYAAMGRVADVVRKSKLKQEDVPNLLVISDMQFDQARGNVTYWSSHRPKVEDWSTAFEKIKQLFHDVGVEVHGEPLQPPTIIFWNVRGAVGYPAAADDEGVVLLSGYSPALMKFLLSGELEGEEVDEEVEEEGGVVLKKQKKTITPTDAMKKALYEDALDPIREVLQALPPHDLRVREGDILKGVVRDDVDSAGKQRKGLGRGGVRGGRGRGRGFARRGRR